MTLARGLEACLREAGAIALEYWRRDVRHWTKGADEPVSDADMAVDAHLKARLPALWPDSYYISEESQEARGQNSDAPFWLVDPIDGTRAFIQGEEDFVISVALMQAGAPIIGAIFHPVRQIFLYAAQGEGASQNGAPIHASRTDAMARARLVGNRRRIEKTMAAQNQTIAGAAFRHSMAWRMALVAMGQYDATISFTPKSDWDLAAGHLLILEAGGRVSDLQNRPLVYGGMDMRHDTILATNGALHHALIRAFDQGA